MSSFDSMIKKAGEEEGAAEAVGPVKRPGGIKVVVKSKKHKKKHARGSTVVAATAATRGFPKQTAASESKSTVFNQKDETDEQELQGDESSTSNAQEDDSTHIPCDTLLAIQSLTQTRKCLDVPLFHNGSVPCVLESQLQLLLQSHDGKDSVVVAELQQLTHANKVRRLVSLDTPSDARTSLKTTAVTTTIQIEAVIETHYYKRAVWDAHRHYAGESNVQVTSAFLDSLDQVTGRRITKRELQSHWPTGNAGTVSSLSSSPPPFTDETLDMLVQMQVLLPSSWSKGNAFLLWLPHWGLVLKQLAKAQQTVIQQLKRSLYKELLKSQVEGIHHAGLSGPFVLHTLVAQGLVQLKERPAGTFACLSKL